jgi:hypothetical protein
MEAKKTKSTTDHDLSTHVCFQTIAPALKLVLHDHLTRWFKGLAKRYRADAEALPAIAEANISLREERPLVARARRRFCPCRLAAPRVFQTVVRSLLRRQSSRGVHTGAPRALTTSQP